MKIDLQNTDSIQGYDISRRSGPYGRKKSGAEPKT
jgi:hypothetical protein